MSDLETNVENLENQPDYQEQYSHRNCVFIHGISETQGEIRNFNLRTINKPLE